MVCDLAELETFFDEEPIIPVQSVMPVFTFIQLAPEIKVPVVVQEEPAFDHEAERLRILEEMRRAEAEGEVVVPYDFWKTIYSTETSYR